MTSLGEQPQVHSNADAVGDGRLSAPSALRNVAPILQAMAGVIPPQGRALEIASGTGQHVAAYGQAFAGVDWQPTDIAPDRLVSIDAWGRGLGNVLGAKMLDASTSDWDIGRFDFVSVTNLFHLISEVATANVITGAARALRPGGVLFVYGPFKVNGGFRSEGDAGFHARITDEDPLAGYKDVDWMRDVAITAGLTWDKDIEMPANNLSLVWREQKGLPT